MKSFLRKWLLSFKSFYGLVVIVFLIWMIFFDNNNIVSRIHMEMKLHTLENEKLYYQQKIVEAKKNRRELMTDDALLEKFAREKYFMKRAKEDVFVIQEQDER